MGRSKNDDTRKADELILAMLQLRDQGLSALKIAHELGVTKGVVSGALNRVDREFSEAAS